VANLNDAVGTFGSLKLDSKQVVGGRIAINQGTLDQFDADGKKVRATHAGQLTLEPRYETQNCDGSSDVSNEVRRPKR
jgi:hypothetical protein